MWLYGGFDGQGALADLWQLEGRGGGAVWKGVRTRGSKNPGARHGHTLTAMGRELCEESGAGGEGRGRVGWGERAESRQRETERERQRETERERGRETDRQRQRETDRQRQREAERERQRERDRQTDRQRQRERDRQTEAERDREKQRDTERETQRDREIERQRETERSCAIPPASNCVEQPRACALGNKPSDAFVGAALTSCSWHGSGRVSSTRRATEQRHHASRAHQHRALAMS